MGKKWRQRPAREEKELRAMEKRLEIKIRDSMDRVLEAFKRGDYKTILEMSREEMCMRRVEKSPYRSSKKKRSVRERSINQS